MREYSCLQAIYMSFYSRSLYRDVFKNWGGGLLLYLMLVLFICWVILMFRVQPMITTGVSDFMQTAVVQLPKDIVIKNGIVTTTENHPYILKYPDSNEVFGIVDTSGKYTEISSTNAQWLITRDRIIYLDERDADGKTVKTHNIPANVNINITPSSIQQFTVKFVGWSWLLLFPFFFIATLIYRLIQSFFYAILGKIYASSAGIPIHFMDIMKLAIVAITPAILISTILEFLGHWSTGHLFIYFVISMAYLIFAIRSVRNEIRNI